MWYQKPRDHVMPMVLGLVLITHVTPRVAQELESPLRCRPEHLDRCRYTGNNLHIYSFEVDGKEISFIYEYDDIFHIKCLKHDVLESSALPYAEPTFQVTDVHMWFCPVPSNKSLSDTMAMLNVSFKYSDDGEPRGLLAINWPPDVTVLTASHFTGLDRLSTLRVMALTNTVSLEPGSLSPLRQLHFLDLWSVTLPTGALDAAPPTLNMLRFRKVVMNQLPEAITSSPTIKSINIINIRALDAGTVPPGVKELVLESSATTIRLEAALELETLRITNWTETKPPPMSTCPMLQTLHLTAPAIRTLPTGWLSNCIRLEELIIEHAVNLLTLPPKLLGAAEETLKLLAFKHGTLEEFPEDVITLTSKLQILDLSSNRLRKLPRRLAIGYDLRELYLSSNDLDNDVFDVLLNNVMIYYILMMDFGNNPRIGNLCEKNGYSRLNKTAKLEQLHLHGTSVTHICKDWREKVLLQTLNLNHTKISELSFEDLQFHRSVRSDVWLMGAPVTVVETTREQFGYTGLAPTSFVSVHLNAVLKCDCRMYWTRRALTNSTQVLDRVSELRCRSGNGSLALREIPVDDMVCSTLCPAAGLPPACVCASRPDEDPTRPRDILRVRCENASLLHMPRFNYSKTTLYELMLANNNIAELQAEELHQQIKGLDLRNNSLTELDEATARKLGDMAGVLRLAGNPLVCECSAAPLLRALHRRASSADLADMTCANGGRLEDAPIVDCTLSVPALLTGLAVISMLLVAAVVVLASRERRFFMKAVLHRWNCLYRADSPEDSKRLYDVYVTFSHKDLVIFRELVTRLESSGYRLCVHYRDWIPGHYIAEQITDSVSQSRRTLALVSKNFLSSVWACAEFREAHTAAMVDGKPRLVVVLLEDPSELDMSFKELKRYIGTRTYLRWGDPWFWDKLAVSLPAPSGNVQPTDEFNDMSPSSPPVVLPSPTDPVSPEEDRLLATKGIGLLSNHPESSVAASNLQSPIELVSIPPRLTHTSSK